MALLSVARTVINEIGWDEGITIPVANAENKLLENEASIVDFRYLSFVFHHHQ